MENKKKMGRPLISDEPKNVSLHLRITKTESERISRCAEKLNCSKTDAIMQGISLVEKRGTEKESDSADET